MRVFIIYMLAMIQAGILIRLGLKDNDPGLSGVGVAAAVLAFCVFVLM